uniref:hypothetical protein n=1 Tax=Peribacillus castrilensis TaxID=2897690 RepID=UPI0027D24B67|nr:hypothetical protein [Peribacillus frigoritolerans]
MLTFILLCTLGCTVKDSFKEEDNIHDQSVDTKNSASNPKENEPNINTVQQEAIKVSANPERITNRHLVVGIDIAQQFHVARAVNYRGILVGHPLTFENNDEGFTKFLSWIKELKRINRLDNEYSRWSGYFKREKSGSSSLG